MYHYLGNERLQLFFFSPNVCAAFLIVTALLTAGLFLFALHHGGKWGKIGGGVLAFSVLTQFILIAQTYSRGGYVSGIIALVTASFFCRNRWSWALPVIFVTILLFTSDGAFRIKSIGEFSDDSIRNRLLLYNYAPGVIARNWVRGTPNSGEYYTRYYQPSWLNARYKTLVNDYFTIGATYGVFALFAVLLLLFGVFQYGLRLYLVTRNELLLYALAALLGYVLSGCFSTIYYYPSMYTLLIILLTSIAGFIVYGVLMHKLNLRKWWLSPTLAGVICVILLIYGNVINLRQAYTWENFELAGRKVIRLNPKSGLRGVLFIPTFGSDLEFRTILRPLTECGYRVITLPIDEGFDELPLARKMLSQLTRQEPNGFLFGINALRAMQVIALSDIAGLAGVIALNPPLDWPFEELALPDNLPKARVPIFLFFDESKRVVLDSLNKLIKSHAIPAKISLLPESEFNSEFVNKIMAIDIIIVFAMHLQKILSSPDR